MDPQWMPALHLVQPKVLSLGWLCVSVESSRRTGSEDRKGDGRAKE